MWSLLRPARRLRIYGRWLGDSIGISPICRTVDNFSAGTAGIGALGNVVSVGCISEDVSHNLSMFERLLVRSCGYCSQAGQRSDDWNDELGVEVGVSSLPDRRASDEIVEEDRNAEEADEEELDSEWENSDANEKGGNHDGSEKREAGMQLLQSILDASKVSDCMDGLVEESDGLSGEDISLVMEALQTRKLYRKGLEFSEWLEASKHFDATEQYYAFHLHCIATARGLHMAERFLKKIPENFRGQLVYLAILKGSVFAGHMKKAEAVFQEMRNIGLPLTVDACNQMLILYKRYDRRRVVDILSTMELEGIRPSLFTCKLLIDLKGLSKDIRGMEELYKLMRAEGMEADVFTLSIMAKHYLSCGLKDKAKVIVQEIEERKKKNAFGANRVLLHLYAYFGKADEVGRIWEDCKSEASKSECMAAIEAWGNLGKLEEAEAVSLMMLKKEEKYTLKHFIALLALYTRHRLFTKGEDLVKQIGDDVWLSPYAWGAMVRLYVAAGDVEKAESILRKAAERRRNRPLFTTFIEIMKGYANKGDINNTEQWFERMRDFGYAARIECFEVLIDAYINARTPAHGFRDRMRADNLFPNKTIAAQIELADAFR
ncbi:hypothetical protein Tsubulata_042235 [Turnera subulata]|uniref:Pentacotripeptide-repeat region of PRORP domain-containing protein n=1 Tax=Turnera subulata TaxID=218843 RepID=A0A9Q0F7U4_9ROSI|nr:hypothetical protein Tsubulata_042235 [Turnera subulata]